MIYTCLKYQEETLLHFQYALKKMKDRKVKQVLSRGGGRWEGEGIRSEGE
jgi:hypothetical protein